MENDYVKIEDNKLLLRDKKSNAILNIDRKAADDYRAKVQMLKQTQQQKDEINIIKEKLSEVDQIKSDLAEIKNLLKGLLK
jgi:hypothetical protein